MGAIPIGHARGSITACLDGRNLRNVWFSLVCFLYHCSVLSTNLPHDCTTICGGLEIRREQGIGICDRRSVMRTSSLARILHSKYRAHGTSCPDSNLLQRFRTRSHLESRRPISTNEEFKVA